MRIKDILKPDCVKFLKGRTKEEVMDELAEFMAKKFNLDKKAVLEAVWEREKKGSTGLEDGLAIPHGRSAIVDDIAMVVGYSPDGVDFDAQDDEPSKLFFFVLASEEYSSQEHLEILMRCAEMWNAGLLERVEGATDEEEIYQAIVETEEEIEEEDED